MTDGLFNLAFCALLGACCWWLWRAARKGRPSEMQVAGFLMPAGLAWLLLPLLAEDTFGALRLLSWVIFVHFPLLLVIATFARWRRDLSAALGLVAATALVAVGVWAFMVEPTRLQVSEVVVQAPALTSPVSVAVLADFQTDRIAKYEKQVLKTLAAQHADLVLLTGDYLQVRAEDRTALRGEFRRAWEEAGIDPDLGVFAVRGNTDPASWKTLFETLNVTVLDDSLADGAGLRAAGLAVLGLSFSESFVTSKRSFPGAPEVDRSEIFRIAFGHGPDFALGFEGADLLLAGHTHGGQVQLPFVGPLVTLSSVPRAWAAGTTVLPDGRGTLVVSRGTGLERGHAPRLRFLCLPEIVVIRLIPEA